MGKKREIFELIDRDCVSSITTNEIKEYIDGVLELKDKYALKNKDLGKEIYELGVKLGNANRKISTVTAFKLNQKINIKWMDLTVPIVITKRTLITDPDTNKSEVYYDYKHDLPNGYTFSRVEEDYLMSQYKIALNEYMEKLIGVK